jgi:hypothetical protein
MLPALHCGVRADHDSPDLEPAEEQAGGIELWHGAGQSPNATDTAILTERAEQVIEEFPADAIDRQIDAPLLEKFLDPPAPLCARGVKRGVRADLAISLRYVTGR